MGAAVDRPARRVCQKLSRSHAVGVFTPSPVTATLSRWRWSSPFPPSMSGVGTQLAEDERQRLADGLDALEVLLRYRDVEALLEGHDELDEVEAVGVEVLLEPGLL